MPRITICYRRDDSGVITGRIFDRLAAHYGRESVFRDIDNIPPGVDFRKHINEMLDASDIVLAIVGPKWVGPRTNQSRLSNAADPVRVEIETALRKDRPVIPVLVLRAAMPRVEQLPESMQDFAFRNAVDIDSGRDFDHHMTGLIRWMDQVIGNTGASAPAVEADAATSAIPAAVSTESASEAASEEPRDLEIENLMRELAAAQQIMAELTRERDELRSKLQSHDRERPPEPRFSTGPSTEERLVAPAVNKPQPWSSSREAVARLTAGHNALNRSDYPEAMRQYLNAAEAGHPVAQYQIGVLYERGQGTARDLNAARAWYVRAAAQGHEDAKRQLERIGLGLLRY